MLIVPIKLTNKCASHGRVLANCGTVYQGKSKCNLAKIKGDVNVKVHLGRFIQ